MKVQQAIRDLARIGMSERSPLLLRIAPMVLLLGIILRGTPGQPSAQSSPDLDGDGVVEFGDFILFSGAFGKGQGQEGFDPRADLDGDGTVGFGDFILLSRAFGNTVEPSSPQALAISGVVRESGRGLAGVTVSLGGDNTDTVTTDVNGEYRFKDLPQGDYTITPSHEGYRFSPSSLTAVLSEVDVTGLNFTASVFPVTRTISGRVTQSGAGLAGVIVVLNGDPARVDTTDASGNYAFYGLLEGTYTVVPTFEDYGFSPSNLDVVLIDAAVTEQDFEVAAIAPPPSGETIGVELLGGLTMDFVFISPGVFQIGSPDTGPYGTDRERPQHEVTITQKFYLGKHEVTQGQWEEVMNTTPWLDQENVEINPDHPAVFISWSDAQAFIQKLNQVAGDSLYRLPTEAEWEYSCRAETTTWWSFGDEEEKLKDYAWYRDNAMDAGEQYAHRVGTKLPNPWGLYDMHGNVEEWVQDSYRIYSGDAMVDPQGPASDSSYVRRGGAFYYLATGVRSAQRFRASTPEGDSGIGFRLVRRIDGQPLQTYSISGRITESNVGLAGVTLILTGARTGSASTDRNGNFSFPGLHTGSYTVIPSKEGYTFSPSDLSVVVSDAPLTDQDFIGVKTPGAPIARVDTTVTIWNDSTMEMVWVTPGTFLMGSPPADPDRHDSEKPQYQVTISQGFYLGKYEVTQGQWEAVMGTTPWNGRNDVQTNPKHPAVYVSWNDAQDFIQRLNAAAEDSLYRLPTEAEWEYACRAGTVTQWSFGEDVSQLTDYAWYHDNAWVVGERYAHQVGTKLPNPWGLYDMHGNVWEWCQDWFGPYPSGTRVNPQGPVSGSNRIVRSGSFSNSTNAAGSAARGHPSPFTRSSDLGFRLLRRAE